MSQRDLAAELRAARVTAPDEVREHVRLVAASDTTPPSRFTLRRALVVGLPVAAAVAAAIVLTRPASTTQHGAVYQVLTTQTAAPARGSATVHGVPDQAAKSLAVPLTSGRVQQYDASLSLRVPSPNDVSTAVKRALRIATALGGYPVSVHAATLAKSGSADLTLKIPRQHVQEAVTRLSALGTITGEQVDLQDLQAGLNATDRLVARLQGTLAQLRSQTQTDPVKRQIAALTARIASLQRNSADTRRTAHYATVSLHLATPEAVHHKPHHGPLHELVVALKWLGIGAVYVLVLGAPLLLVAWLTWIVVRTIRRRREDELLSRP